MRQIVTLLALSLLLAACAGDAPSRSSSDGSGSGVTVRDSAGIRIVENHDSVWTASTRWRLADEPDFVIGSLDGSVPGTDFGRFVVPQLLGAATVVLDTSNDDLRLFDAGGVFVETIARRGEGPVELLGASRVHTFGDSVVAVYDSRGPKIVRFDVAADSAWSTAMGQPPGEPQGGLRIGGMSSWALRDWFADGSYLVYPNIISLSGHPSGESVTTSAWHHVSAAGEHVSEVGAFPAMAIWSDGETSTGMAFTATGMVVALDSTLLQAFPDDGFEFVERRTGGTVKTIVRAAIPRRPVTDAMVAALRESELAFHRAGLEGASASLREIRERTADLQASRPYPDSVAPFVDLVATPSGHVFAELANPEWTASRRPDTPDPPRTRVYVVFDRDGRWLGTLDFPAGFVPTDIGDRYVLGYRTDEFDVRYIERWRLIKP